MNPQNTIICVSMYKTPIPWADKLREKGFIVQPYTKEDSTSPYNVSKNVGNEASAYLKYILDNYECLPEYTIFLHDHETSYHQEGSIIDAITARIGHTAQYFNFNIVNNAEFYLYEATGLILLYKEFLEEYTGPLRQYGEFTLGSKLYAQFQVHKSLITARPRKMYENIYNWMMTCNPDKYIAGFFMEVFWDIIFGQIRPIEYFPRILVIASNPPQDTSTIYPQYGTEVFKFYHLGKEDSGPWKSMKGPLEIYDFIIQVDPSIKGIVYDHILTQLYYYNLVKANIFLTLSGDPEGQRFFIKSSGKQDGPLTRLTINDSDLNNSPFLGNNISDHINRFKIRNIYDKPV